MRERISQTVVSVNSGRVADGGEGIGRPHPIRVPSQKSRFQQKIVKYHHTAASPPREPAWSDRFPSQREMEGEGGTETKSEGGRISYAPVAQAGES